MNVRIIFITSKKPCINSARLRVSDKNLPGWKNWKNNKQLKAGCQIEFNPVFTFIRWSSTKTSTLRIYSGDLSMTIQISNLAVELPSNFQVCAMEAACVINLIC